MYKGLLNEKTPPEHFKQQQQRNPWLFFIHLILGDVIQIHAHVDVVWNHESGHLGELFHDEIGFGGWGDERPFKDDPSEEVAVAQDRVDGHEAPHRMAEQEAGNVGIAKLESEKDMRTCRTLQY